MFASPPLRPSPLAPRSNDSSHKRSCDSCSGKERARSFVYEPKKVNYFSRMIAKFQKHELGTHALGARQQQLIRILYRVVLLPALHFMARFATWWSEGTVKLVLETIVGYWCTFVLPIQLAFLNPVRFDALYMIGYLLDFSLLILNFGSAGRQIKVIWTTTALLCKPRSIKQNSVAPDWERDGVHSTRRGRSNSLFSYKWLSGRCSRTSKTSKSCIVPSDRDSDMEKESFSESMTGSRLIHERRRLVSFRSTACVQLLKELLKLIPYIPFDVLLWFEGSQWLIPKVRLVRLYFVPRLVNHFHEVVESSQVMPFLISRYFRVTMVFVCCTHWLGCIMHYVSQQSGASYYETAPWVPEDSAASYLWASYFSIMSLTQNNMVIIEQYGEAWEVTVGIVMAVLSTLCFVYVNSNITSLIMRHTQALENYRQRLTQVDGYLGRNRVSSKDVRRAVKLHFEMRLDDNERADQDLLDQLPHALRRQVLTDIYMRTIRHIPLFKGCDPTLLQLLCNVIKRATMPPETVLCNQGDLMREMYFLEAGELLLFSDEEGCVAEQHSGSFHKRGVPLRANSKRNDEEKTDEGGCSDSFSTSPGQILCCTSASDGDSPARIIARRRLSSAGAITNQASRTRRWSVQASSAPPEALNPQDAKQPVAPDSSVPASNGPSAAHSEEDADRGRLPSGPFDQDVCRQTARRLRKASFKADLVSSRSSASFDPDGPHMRRTRKASFVADLSSRRSSAIEADGPLTNTRGARRASFVENPNSLDASAASNVWPFVVATGYTSNSRTAHGRRSSTVMGLLRRSEEVGKEGFEVVKTAGTSVAEVSFLFGLKQDVTVEAIKLSTCLTLDKEAYASILEQFPQAEETIIANVKRQLLAKQRWSMFGAVEEASKARASLYKLSDAFHACSVGDLIELERGLKARGATLLSETDYEERSCLHIAAISGQRNVVKRLCDANARVDSIDSAGRTALDYALLGGNKEIVALLRVYGARLGWSSAEQGYQLCDALRRNSLSQLQVLLEGGVAPNAAYLDNRCALHYAAAWGDSAAVELLLQYKADVNVKDRNGSTPLREAVLSRQPAALNILKMASGQLGYSKEEAGEELFRRAWKSDVDGVRMLLECGIDADARGPEGRSALHVAALLGSVELASLLVEGGADVSALDRSGDTPLSCALVEGHDSLALFLHDAEAKLGSSEGQLYDRLCTLVTRSDLTGIDVLARCWGSLDGVNRDQRTVLHVAASMGNEQVVQDLIERGAFVNAKDRWGVTPLREAVRQGHAGCAHRLHEAGGMLEMDKTETAMELCRVANSGRLEQLKLILQCGADADSSDHDSRTCMHFAASIGNLPMLVALVNNDADINPKDRWGQTPLMDALKFGHVEAAKFLNSNGAELEYKEEAHAAAEMCNLAFKGKLDLIKVMLECGADVNAADYDFRTCLHIAASEGSMALVEMLIEQDAEINYKDRWGGTPLRDAIRQGHTKVAMFLHQNGGDMGFNDVEAASELGILARDGSTEKIRTMMMCGVNVDASDYDMRTCLHIASSHGSMHIVEALLAAGANVNPVDRWGRTPVQDAVRHGHSGVAAFLVKSGAKLLMEEHELAFQLCFLARKGRSESLSDLLDCGADVNTSDYDGRTPLHIAASEGHKSVVQALIERNASPDTKDRWGNSPKAEAERAGHNWHPSIWSGKAPTLPNQAEPPRWAESARAGTQNHMEFPASADTWGNSRAGGDTPTSSDPLGTTSCFCSQSANCTSTSYNTPTPKFWSQPQDTPAASPTFWSPPEGSPIASAMGLDRMPSRSGPSP